MKQYLQRSQIKVFPTKNLELSYTLSLGNIGGGYAPPKWKERHGIQKAGGYTQETAKGNSQIDGEGRSQDECVPSLEDNQSDTSPRGLKALGEPC